MRALRSAVLLGLVGLCPLPSWAGEVQLSWQAPTMNEDDSPLTDLAGYRCYAGRSSLAYGAPLAEVVGTSCTLTTLEPDTTYFLAVTAFDLSNNESIYSEEVSVHTPPLSGDQTPPVVTWLTPPDGSRVPRKSQVTVEATVEDESPVTVGFWVKFNTQPFTLICTVTSPPYQCVWTVPSAGGKKVYTLQASAVDTAGHEGQSALVQVTAQ